jgi:uncharacterized repeat protein (TIGR01451 family)
VLLATSPLLNTFELDGNAQTSVLGGPPGSSDIASHDWDQVYSDNITHTLPPNSSGAGDSTFLVDPSSSPTDQSLTGGQTKDTNGFSQWKWVTATVPQAKNDLSDAYGAVYTYTGPPVGNAQTGDLFIFTGADRIDNSGDATAGFWFLQSQATPVLKSDGTFNIRHQNNDLLLVLDFGGGGTAPAVPRFFKWVGNDTTGSLSGPFTPSDPNVIFGIANGSTVPSPWPFTPKPGPGNSNNNFSANMFVEGGIDLNAAFPGVPPSQLCFSTFLVETRTSTSPTSTLSDFTFGSLETCPDVTVTKTADASPINAGDTAGFTITVSNDGVGAAHNVTLSDTLPTGLGNDVIWSIDSNPSGDFQISPTNAVGQTLSFTSGVTLQPGHSISVHISGVTHAVDTNAASYTGTLPNTVTVNCDGDENPNNNSASATITVQAPDVKVVKTADASPINAGETAGFTVTVSNHGLGTAHGVTLTDSLPVGSGSDINWTIFSQSPASSFVISGATGSQTLSLVGQPGDLAAGASLTVDIRGVTSAADAGTLPNTAVVAATNENSGNTGDNTSSATITVQAPSLSITKTADSSTVTLTDTSPLNSNGLPTATVGFTIEIANAGPGNATGVTLSDPLPGGGGHDIVWSIDTQSSNVAGVAFVINGSTPYNQSLVFNPSSVGLPAGALLSVHITGTATEADCGSIPNTATVSASNDGSESSSATITIDETLHTVYFDPTGLGHTDLTSAPVIKVATFDQSPGNTLAIGALPLPAVGDPGRDFQVLYQSTLSALLDLNGNPLPSSGLGTTYQILTEAVFWEHEVQYAPGVVVFSPPTGTHASDVQLIYHPLGAGHTAIDNRTGAGYAFSAANGDIVIAEGTVTPTSLSGSAIQTSSTPTTLDQAPGATSNTQTLTFSGSTVLAVAINNLVLGFFPDSHQTISTINFSSLNSTPFFNVGALQAPGTYFNGTSPNIGTINGLNGTDVEFQTDGSSSVIVNCLETPRALLADSTGTNAGAASLTESQLQSAVNAALANWAAAGVSPGSVNVLQHVPVTITNLPGTTLGLTSAGGISISQNAAGWGWFTNASASPTPGSMDLLTVVEHELGHVLGFEHSAAPGVMEATLAPGVRFAPGADPAAGGALGSVSNVSISSNPAVQPLNILVSTTASGVATTGTASAQTTALPTQPSAQIAFPTSAPSVLTTLGLTPILAMTPSGTPPSQMSPMLSGRAAITMNGIAAVGPDSPTCLMPLPPRVGMNMRPAGASDDPVLWNREDSDNGEPTDQLIPAIHLDGIPQVVPAAPAVPVEKDPPAGVLWKRGCEAYLEDEEWAGWFMSRDKVAARTRGEDEVLNSELKPLAAVAAFGVALSASRALTSQTPDPGLGGLSSTARPRPNATRRRPGRPSRWFPLGFRRQA